MLAEYFNSGEKAYVEADLVVDGTTIPSVGVRLKGNSTLSGLTWKGESRQAGLGGTALPAFPKVSSPRGVPASDGAEMPPGGPVPAGSGGRR